MGGLVAERLQRSGATVIFSTPALVHSGFLALTLEQNRALSRLTELGVVMFSSRELSAVENGQATLVSTLGADPLVVEIDHTVVVADRVPIDGLAKQLRSDPDKLNDAGILSVDSVGDCVAPGLIAHAVYAAHRLALNF
jgi:dimethylamine/trimethylamine dehydrogenase